MLPTQIQNTEQLREAMSEFPNSLLLPFHHEMQVDLPNDGGAVVFHGKGFAIVSEANAGGECEVFLVWHTPQKA